MRKRSAVAALVAAAVLCLAFGAGQASATTICKVNETPCHSPYSGGFVGHVVGEAAIAGIEPTAT